MLGRLTRDLPAFLRTPVTLEHARARLRDRLARRADRFLDLMERAVEKLNSEGVTYVRANVLPVVEEALPRRFGGAGPDYQLVEEEAGDASTRLVLRVHPSVGPVDEAAVRQAFLDELVRGGGLLDRYQAEVLRRAGSVVVSREPPIATRAGKILPFQLVRDAGRPPSG